MQELDWSKIYRYCDEPRRLEIEVTYDAELSSWRFDAYGETPIESKQVHIKAFKTGHLGGMIGYNNSPAAMTGAKDWYASFCAAYPLHLYE